MRLSQILLITLASGLTSTLSAQDQARPPALESLDLSGVLLLNAFYNDDLIDNREVPLLAAPTNPISGDRMQAVGSSVRQSRVSATARASGVFGADVEGEIDLDFFGGLTDPSRPDPQPRIRRIVGRVNWPNAWLLFGQETLPISSIDPASFSTVSVPGFTGSGNLSRWMPQLRLGIEMGTSLRVGVEAAAIAPRFNTTMEDESPNPDPAELARRPFVQGRLLTRWGSDGNGGEVSVGGHYGWYEMGADSLGVTKAGAVSARFFVTPMLEFRGEAFLGEALGMLGGGGIDQILSPDGAPVRTKGGWAQLIVHVSPQLDVGGGYGLDDPDNGDLDPVTGISYNATWEMHGHLHISSLILAAEYRRLETRYMDSVYYLETANHLNLALGFQF